MSYGPRVMIGRLRGVVAVESPDGTVVVDVQGVGYEVMAPLGSLGRATREGGDVVTLYIVTHVREDAITLFGFASEHERATFRVLTTVAGIGPRIAVSILGALPPQELAAAVARNDVKRLQAVPGVGRRLAERIALELKDKLAPGTTSFTGSPTPNTTTTHGSVGSTASAGPMGVFVATLVNLGFKVPEAERVAAEFAHRQHEALDVLVRDALKRLVK